MKTSNSLLYLALILLPVAAAAAEPVLNVSASRHGNLATAQQLSRQAYDKITAAQQVNDDMGGHASKAKQLLIQANNEIKLAADAINSRR